MGSFRDIFFKSDEDMQNEQSSSESAKEMTPKDFYEQSRKKRTTAPSVNPNIPSQQPTADAFAKPSATSYQPAQPTTYTPTSSAESQTNTTTDDVDENIIRSLWGEVLKCNIEGPDYCEIRDTASGLMDEDMTIQQVYRIAYKTLKRQYPQKEFTKETILKSIDFYTDVIQKQASIAKQQCDEKRKRNIGDRKDNIARLNDTIAEIHRQKAELEAREKEAMATIETLTSEIDTAMSQIDIEEAKFNNSVQFVLSSLSNDRNIISTLDI